MLNQKKEQVRLSDILKTQLLYYLLRKGREKKENVYLLLQFVFVVCSVYVSPCCGLILYNCGWLLPLSFCLILLCASITSVYQHTLCYLLFSFSPQHSKKKLFHNFSLPNRVQSQHQHLGFQDTFHKSFLPPSADGWQLVTIAYTQCAKKVKGTFKGILLSLKNT